MSGKEAKCLSGASVLQALRAANGALGTKVTSAMHRHPLPLTSADCQSWDGEEPMTELGKRLYKMSLICNLPFCVMTKDFPINCSYMHTQSSDTSQTTD